MGIRGWGREERGLGIGDWGLGLCQCLGDAGDEKFRVCRVVNLCSVSSPVSLGCGEGSDLGDASGGSFLQYASPVCSRRSGSGDGLARGRAGSAGGGGTRWSIESSAGDDALLTVDQGIPRQPRPAGEALNHSAPVRGPIRSKTYCLLWMRSHRRSKRSSPARLLRFHRQSDSNGSGDTEAAAGPSRRAGSARTGRRPVSGQAIRPFLEVRQRVVAGDGRMGTELAAGFPERDVGPVPGTSTGRALSVGVASLRPISEWRVFRPKPAAELPPTGLLDSTRTVRRQCPPARMPFVAPNICLEATEVQNRVIIPRHPQPPSAPSPIKSRLP